MAHPQLVPDSGADTPDLERDLAGVLRTMRVDEREAWRKKDVIRGKLHAARHLDLLLRGAQRARTPLDDALRLPAALEGFVLDLYASDPATQPMCWITAFRYEQQVNGETDLAQHAVFESRGDRVAFASALRNAAARFARQRQASGLCERAVRQALIAGRIA